MAAQLLQRKMARKKSLKLLRVFLRWGLIIRQQCLLTKTFHSIIFTGTLYYGYGGEWQRRQKQKGHTSIKKSHLWSIIGRVLLLFVVSIAVFGELQNTLLKVWGLSILIRLFQPVELRFLPHPLMNTKLSIISAR